MLVLPDRILAILQKLPSRDYLSQCFALLGIRKVCELGVENGANFQNLYRGNPELLVGVDIWEDFGLSPRCGGGVYDKGQPQQVYQRLLEKYKLDPMVRLIRSFTVQAASLFSDGFFDLVYIDADHTFEGVSADIAAWYPKVVPGGIIAGHDFQLLGVRRAVEILCYRFPRAFFYVMEPAS